MMRLGAAPLKQICLCCGIFLMCAALLLPVQKDLQRRIGDPAQDPDLLYFRSPSVLKRMALGHDQLLADFYWMRVIQYYGRRNEADQRSIRYKNIAALLDITTSLDPDLTDAYSAGALFLAEADPVGAGQPQQALDLLDKGIRSHPKEWRFFYDKGFIYYMYLKDYSKAAEAWLAGSRQEDAPHFMEPLAAMSSTKGGAVEVALALWNNQYRESTRADVRENARNHMISIEVARDIWSLEFLLEKHKAKTGVFPQSLVDLVQSRKSKYRIVDPLGTPYSYNPATGAVSLNAESKVKYMPVPYSYKEELRLTIDD